MKPAVRSALAALDQFGITDPEQAMAVLSWWPRYDELTPNDLTVIEAIYRPEGPKATTSSAPLAPEHTR